MNLDFDGYKQDRLLVAELLLSLKDEGRLSDEAWRAVQRFWAHRGDNRELPPMMIS